jgi:glycerophosphodiester phosphodiesterase
MNLDFLEQKSWENVDSHELRYFLGIFIQCRSMLKELQWYGKVNEYGFRRLLHKLEHLRSYGSNASLLSDIDSKLSTVQFSSQTTSRYDLQCVQSSIAAITRIISRHQSASNRSLILDHFVSHCYSSLNRPEVAHEAIQRDNWAALDQFIKDINMATTEKGQNQMLILVFMQLSIIYGSKTCIEKLLLLTKSIHNDNFTAKNYLPLVIIRVLVKMGHAKMLASHEGIKLTFTQIDGDSISLLRHILAVLDADTQAGLLTPDSSFKRLPLHYAAQYGLSEACQLILNHIQGVRTNDEIPSSESVLLRDCLGNSPLKLAVACGHTEVSKLLLEFYTREKSHNKSPSDEIWNILSGCLLADALRSNPDILKYLLVAQANVDYQGVHGETALYIAARFGNEDAVELLLSHKASTSVVEKAHGWTPLFVASVEGHIPIVELLLQAGASQEGRDILGWTALDHAAFKGHIKLVTKLRESVRMKSLANASLTREVAVSARTPPIHRAIGGNLILVNLGSFNSYKTLTAVDLSPYLSTYGPTMESEVGFLIEISLMGGPYYLIDLPILEDMINKPWSFFTEDPGNAKLMFKIYRKTTIENGFTELGLIGSGIALLGSLKQGLGSTRESLIRDYNIPILAKDTLEDIGTVTFSFLVVKPFSYSKPSTPARDILWRDGWPTKVVGHRGLYSDACRLYILTIAKVLVRILQDISTYRLEKTRYR